MNPLLAGRRFFPWLTRGQILAPLTALNRGGGGRRKHFWQFLSLIFWVGLLPNPHFPRRVQPSGSVYYPARSVEWHSSIQKAFESSLSYRLTQMLWFELSTVFFFSFFCKTIVRGTSGPRKLNLLTFFLQPHSPKQLQGDECWVNAMEVSLPLLLISALKAVTSPH